MAGLLVNLGEVRMLSLLTNDGQALENNVLRLYQNDKTPAETDTAGDYTQATFTGYVAITLTATDWTITSGAPSDATALEKTFSSVFNHIRNKRPGHIINMTEFATGAQLGVVKDSGVS